VVKIAVLFCVLFVNRAPGGEIVATIDGSPISAEVVQQTAARNAQNLFTSEGASNALNDTLTFELLAAEAKAQGYMDDPEIVEMAKKMAVQKLVRDKVDNEIQQTVLAEEELRAWYDSHPEEFSQPSLAKARIIEILKSEGRDGGPSPSEIKARVDLATQKIKDGYRYEDIVNEFSDDAVGRAQGGLSNWFIENEPSRRYSPEVQSALFKLEKTGDTVGPIETPKAFYFLQLAELRQGRVTAYEQAKRTISQTIYRRKRLDAYNAYAEQLKATYPVVVDNQALEKLVEQVKQGDGPPSGPVPVEVEK